jgi:hypothetical protein
MEAEKIKNQFKKSMGENYVKLTDSFVLDFIYSMLSIEIDYY